MSQSAKEASHLPARLYQISISGKLEPSWSEWLGGMTLTHIVDPDGAPVTCLSGTLPDQGALRGVLNRIWDLNLTLLSVTCDDPNNGGINERHK